MNRLHESIAGSASICLAAASRIPGSVVERVAEHRQDGQLLIGHPSGVTPTKVESHPGPHGATFGRPRLQPNRPTTHGRHRLLPHRA